MPGTIGPPQGASANRHAACWLILLGLFSSGLSGLLTLSGCSRPPRLATPTDLNPATPRSDPWDNALRQLRKETTFTVCRSVLQTLNNDLAADETLRSTLLSAGTLDALQRYLPLDAADREELRSASFTPHDAAYLADCLYLRDAARQMVLPELSAREKAERAFAWVCRQVWLHPWLVETERGVMATALPPTAVLRRGTGSGLERMYVFLAVLQQLGLDGCLLGPPEAVDHRAGHVALAGGKTLTGSPRGPFWAVGVRLQDDILLFDPWQEAAFPAGLKAMQANPAAYKDWLATTAGVSGLTAEALASARVYLTVPLNALTPRMRLLHDKLSEPLQVHLAMDLEQLRERFAAWQPHLWNPPDDRFAYGRASRTFLPTDHGGTDTAPMGQRLFDLYYLSQLPPPVQVIPAELRQNIALVRDVGERIAQVARSHYAVRFLEPPTPRERIQRGQFQDAARLLVGLQDEFGRGLSRIRNTPEADRLRREWIAQAAELYEQLGRDPGVLKRIEQHWRTEAAALLLDQAICEVGQAEATFLLALCQHEQAERVQLRYEHAGTGDAARLRQDARQAWEIAARAWRTYRGQYAAFHAALPGRAPLADRLAARAERLARP
ncbi:MAG: hypothetical protein NZU63_04540 [Gemmataceae bacterium]|nr:hypothetical protein [Gemmataceae bacterium]